MDKFWSGSPTLIKRNQNGLSCSGGGGSTIRANVRNRHDAEYTCMLDGSVMLTKQMRRLNIRRIGEKLVSGGMAVGTTLGRADSVLAEWSAASRPPEAWLCSVETHVPHPEAKKRVFLCGTSEWARISLIACRPKLCARTRRSGRRRCRSRCWHPNASAGC
jgi:hypothetical protein